MRLAWQPIHVAVIVIRFRRREFPHRPPFVFSYTLRLAPDPRSRQSRYLSNSEPKDVCKHRF